MFYQTIGKFAIGSRLRTLSERINHDATQIYALYDIPIKPKWFPVFFVLSKRNLNTVTTIAEEIGQSHPSVVKISREMIEAGLIKEQKDLEDGRRNILTLTKKGKTMAEQLEEAYKDVRLVIEQMIAQTRHNIWEAMNEFEFLLDQKNIYNRVYEQKKRNAMAKVTIVDYSPTYQEVFKVLNQAWIEQYFKMEKEDHRALDNPQEYILDKGGHIFVALLDEEPVGVCALIKMENSVYEYELAKMAVSPKAQGKGIGYLLGEAIKEKAKVLGSKNLYLESNTILKPAIRLYQKLGFEKVAGQATPYERCNIQMAMEF